MEGLTAEYNFREGPTSCQGVWKCGLWRGLLYQIKDSQRVTDSVPPPRAVVRINEFIHVKLPELQAHSMHVHCCY